MPDDGMIRDSHAAAAAAKLSAGPGECPDCGTAAPAVPDMLEEMVQRTLDDNGNSGENTLTFFSVPAPRCTVPAPGRGTRTHGHPWPPSSRSRFANRLVWRRKQA